MTKKQERWLGSYYEGFVSQAEVMRRLDIKLNNRNTFYRLFHHYVMRTKKQHD